MLYPPLSQKNFQKRISCQKNSGADRDTPKKKQKYINIGNNISNYHNKTTNPKKNIAEYTDTKIKKTGKIHYTGQTTQPFIKRDQEHRRKKDNHLSDNKIQKILHRI